jgi:hypothetical protein
LVGEFHQFPLLLFFYIFFFRLELSEGSGEGDLSLALLTGNMELAVELAVQQAKWADALILAAQVSWQ